MIEAVLEECAMDTLLTVDGFARHVRTQTCDETSFDRSIELVVGLAIDYRPAPWSNRISQMSPSLTALVKYSRRASGDNAIETIARPRSGSA